MLKALFVVLLGGVGEGGCCMMVFVAVSGESRVNFGFKVDS